VGVETIMARSVEIAEGATVVDARGRSLGRIITVEYEHIVVEQGFLFTRTLYIPTSAVARVDAATETNPGKVYLNIGRDDAEKAGKVNSFKEQRDYVGAPADEARFASAAPTATAGFTPSRHTPDDFAAPSSYGDPWNGGDQTPDDVALEGVPTLGGNAPTDRTINEQAQLARRPAKK
jgi:hypothetical protein